MSKDGIKQWQIIPIIKNGKTEAKVLPPFILYEKDGIMTSSYEKIYLGEE